MASVSISGVRKSYGGTTIIHGVDLEIDDAEFLVLVGPSGCGKSTLLRMIAGLEEIDGGEIRIGGRVMNGIAPKDRDIAMVFQSYALYPHMSVRQNMSLALKLRGVSRAEVAERVSAAAAILGLETLLDRLPGQLSGGQRQRVAMGRAIVRDPQVFLFDEALSNLDTQLRVQMRGEIKTLHQRLKTTSIYVTHDQMEAMTLADRIVLMRGGHIEQIGPPLELYDLPRNRFVAEFMGSPAINLLAGRVDRSDGQTRVVMADGTSLPIPLECPAPDGAAVHYGIRPEHLAFSGEAPGSIAAIVRSVEPTGALTHVLVEIAGQNVQVLSADRHLYQPGQRVEVTPLMTKIHLFDALSGMAYRA